MTSRSLQPMLGGGDAPARPPSPHRLAELVADGIVPFPLDLPGPDAAALAVRIRKLRRDRLVRLVARAIAADLAADRPRRPT